MRAATRPNILLITCHDLGRFLGCYGVPTVQTPHLDALATRGVRPEVAEVESGLRAAILVRFDPDAIAADVAASVRRRELIGSALERNQTSWDYEPIFDASRQCVR